MVYKYPQSIYDTIAKIITILVYISLQNALQKILQTRHLFCIHVYKKKHAGGGGPMDNFVAGERPFLILFFFLNIIFLCEFNRSMFEFSQGFRNHPTTPPPLDPRKNDFI